MGEVRQGKTFLETYSKAWHSYSRAVHQINSLCMYVNKVIEKLRDEHLPKRTLVVLVNGERMEVRIKTVSALGFHIWKKAVLFYAKIEIDNILVKEIMRSFQQLRMRDKSSIPLESLKGAIRSFYDCDQKEFLGPVAVPFKQGEDAIDKLPTLYESDIERPFIEETIKFYAFESTSKISNEDTTGYVTYAEGRLREEIQYAKSLFPTSSCVKIVAAVEAQLVTCHTETLQSSFSRLLESQMNTELEIVYRLLERIPEGIEPLAKCFEEYVFIKGKRTLEEIPSYVARGNCKVAAVYVFLLGPLSREFKHQINTHFNDDRRFLDRVANAFRALLSIHPPCSKKDTGSILADFFDLLLQDEVQPDRGIYGKFGKATEQFQECINDAIELVEYLEDKESFVKPYITHLAKRLIYRLSHHGEADVLLIPRIGELCGYEAQVRMGKMFSDVHTAVKHRGPFGRFALERNFSIPCELQVQIPTYVVWPIQFPMDPADPSARLPAELEATSKQFTNYYKKEYPNRQLYWMHHLSRVILSHPNSKNKNCEIIATIPQANVLCQFRKRDSVSASELMNVTGLNWVDFCDVIKPITSIELLKWSVEEGGEPLIAHNLEYNSNWNSSKSKIRICHFSLGSSLSDEDIETFLVESSTDVAMQIEQPEAESAALSDNRKFFLQAIIVKLLKQHTKLSSVRMFQLVSEIAILPGPISFQPTPAQVDSVIDQLVEKQYLDYDSRHDVYIYIP